MTKKENNKLQPSIFFLFRYQRYEFLRFAFVFTLLLALAVWITAPKAVEVESEHFQEKSSFI